MRSTATAAVLAGLVVAVACGPRVARALDDASQRRLVAGAREALGRFDTPAARAVLDDLLDRGGDGDDVAVLRAEVLLAEGRYAEARDALEGIRDDDPWLAELRAVIDAGDRAMSGAVEILSEHFAIRCAPGVDELVARLAVEVAEASYEEVGTDLGLFPDEPVLIEIYPSSSTFSAAAGLPPEAVANDTVGLCRFGRLLLTSPAAAPFGYPWADTLCHEYTHLLVHRLGGGRVPVWLHEGVASFEQRRWRGETGTRLDPFEMRALAEALDGDGLVTFDEMGTCLSCLETPERVRLGYAQVHTMIDHLVRGRGMEALARVLAAVAGGADPAEALGAAWGSGFEDFESSWAEAARRLTAAAAPAVGRVSLDLDGAGAQSGPDTPAPDSLLEGSPDALSHARLGDLLLARDQPAAALLEYERAAALMEQVSPSLSCKMAYALRDLGRHERAVEVLGRAWELYPAFEPVAVNMARSLAELGRREHALAMLREAELLNPFDPRIHAARVELLGGGGADDDALRQRSERALRLLGAAAAGEKGEGP